MKLNVGMCLFRFNVDVVGILVNCVKNCVVDEIDNWVVIGEWIDVL